MDESKLRPCLRCGKPFLTTPEHRICVPCSRVNDGQRTLPAHYDDTNRRGRRVTYKELGER